MDAVAFIGLKSRRRAHLGRDGRLGQWHDAWRARGLLLRELILGRDHPWAKLYDPSRKTIRAVGDFARENLNMAAQYASWLTGGDVHDV
jgi:hypothetical protein